MTFTVLIILSCIYVGTMLSYIGIKYKSLVDLFMGFTVLVAVAMFLVAVFGDANF